MDDKVLQSPQLHSLFGSLGFLHGDTYHIKENCNDTLKLILSNILDEDKYLRTFRRSISFGQNIQKDLIPLLLHTKDAKSIELIVEILVNLTIPIECLLSAEVIFNTDFGRLTVLELNNLLASAKVAFTDQRATKAIIKFLRNNIEEDKITKLSSKQCNNICNSLLLLRNILHIPEDVKTASSHNLTGHACQNQIIWNIFSQGIDKLLIKLMTIPESHIWGVTMVQVIALLYKDQHVLSLHKLLNIWLETSLSESSDDNESNTSPQNRDREDLSPNLTSDPTSDSSDTGGGGGKVSEKCGWGSGNSGTERIAFQSRPFQPERPPKPDATENMSCSGSLTERKSYSNSSNSVIMNKKVISVSSDCGYGTQIENQEVSTSSNDDEKPVHKKPHNPKQRINMTHSITAVHEKKRKKVVKRAKANVVNVQGLLHRTPNNEDISHVLKEFTVDFLLKGYNSLVRTLYTQILTNVNLEIDVSHFLWLITYFLKFASQIELGLEHLHSVLSYDILAYLTAEGVNLCEQFQLAIRLDGKDLKASIRRLHLVVTAIREFIQAIEAYKKCHVHNDDKDALVKLQLKICDTEELRSLFVLLLRNYNSWYHSKQYLQDLIVTNHLLLLFLDDTMKMPAYKGALNMLDHIKQFASPEIMSVYNILLEDYAGNGEFVNDCIFTLMHHVGTVTVDSLISLYQPNILRTFTIIWESEFDICDDWSDLIEYVINTFIKKPSRFLNMTDSDLTGEEFKLNLTSKSPLVQQAPVCKIPKQVLGCNVPEQATVPEVNKVKAPSSSSSSCTAKWTDDELSVLNWNFMQCKSKPDVIGELVRLFKEDRVYKSRRSVINELHKQNIITQHMYEEYKDKEESSKGNQHKDSRDDEIGKLCEQLVADGKEPSLVWVQRVLLQTCYVKLQLSYGNSDNDLTSSTYTNEANRVLFKEKCTDYVAISPVSYNCLKLNQSIPLVTWNCEQAAICKDLKFLQLLNKLGFYMPVDSDKVFIRIPHFWTADALFNVASKISTNHNANLKSMIQGLSDCTLSDKLCPSVEKKIPLVAVTNTLYQVQEQTKLPSAVNFTPAPGSSYHNNGSDKPAADVAAPNWLEIVRRSQEIGLNKGPRRVLVTPPPSSATSPLSPLVPLAPLDPLVPLAPLAPLAPDFPQCLISPHCDFPVPPLLADCDDNSLCDAASVASDLTRMYVSDEEDKLEPLGRVLHRRTSDLAMELTDTSDLDCARAGKRVCHRLDNA